jgi:hypothetical protein
MDLLYGVHPQVVAPKRLVARDTLISEPVVRGTESLAERREETRTDVGMETG